MAWNQQNQDNKPDGERPDPWGRGKGSKRPSSGPPDMEDFLQKLLLALRRLLLDAGDWRLLVLVLPALLALGLVSGFYVVQASEQGVVERLGRFSDLAGPGLHWRVPVLDSVRMVDVGSAHQLPLSATVISTDGSIVEVSLELDYRVSDARRYLQSAADPEAVLTHAAEAELRHALGEFTLNQALQAGQLRLSGDLPGQLQASLDHYQTGLTLSSVHIADVHLPKEVQPDADLVAAAHQKTVSDMSKAEADATQLRSDAHTQAGQLLADASAYKTEAIDRAQAESDRLGPLLAEYHKAPAVVRERLYLDTMVSLLSKVSTVVVGDRGINPVINLGGDKAHAGVSAAAATSGASGRQP